MQAYLLIKSLFTTVECKLLDRHNLQVTRLSLSGSDLQKISVNRIKKEVGQTLPNYASVCVAIIGSLIMLACIVASQYSALLHNNLLSLLSFGLCITAASVYLCRPVNTIKYRDIYSDQVLFTITQQHTLETSTGLQTEFINSLDQAIETAQAEEANRINLKNSLKQQLETHNKNVDDLFNLGLIDEALYKRICNSMHEKVFGKPHKHTLNNNVVYLHR